MIAKWLGAKALSFAFGGGLGADVASRGAVYLADEVRQALRRDELPVSRVRLEPGETYTVIARPRPTRLERKLADRQAALLRSYRSASTATRKQKKAARRLARAQRRLNRTTVGSKRHTRRTETEQRRGLEFDRVMRPSRRQLRSAEKLDQVTRELDALRAARLQTVRRRFRPGLRVSTFG